MKLTFKRIAVLLLCGCLAVSLLQPLAVKVHAEDITAGTLVSDNVISEYKNGVYIGLTENAEGQDLLAVPIYGEKMVVYNLDTWEVADEVYTGVPNPRGATVDKDGKVWVCGDARTLCCYDPVSRACFISSNIAVGAGSFFAITQGEDGNLYFGTYSNAKIVRYDIENDTYVDLGTPVVAIDGAKQSFSYASAVVQKGAYIYATLHGETAHYLVQLDLDGSLVKALDIAAEMGTTRYLSGLNFIEGTDILVGYGTSESNGAITVDTATMTKLDDLGGYTMPIKGNVSESNNSKVYFASYDDRTINNKAYQDVLYSYDLTTKTAEAVCNGDGDYLYGNILRSNQRNFADGIDHLGIKGPCLVTIQGTFLIVYDIEKGERYQFSGEDSPVNASQGTGQSLRAATNGLPGSNEIYFGAYDTNTVASYNTATGAITKVTTAAGSQTDSFCWYEGALYCGNYNVASLTWIDGGKAKSLFQLNNTVFEQARIHTITAGDGKIFAGTTPDMYCHGGTISWYDTSNGLTYVATGPNKSDVYYAKTFDNRDYTAGDVNSGLISEPVWYNAATDQEVSLTRKDFAGGVIASQTINNLVYDAQTNLLYGTSSIYGGTNTKPTTKDNAVLFVYDMDKMEVAATCDLAKELTGFTSQVEFVAGLAKDPDYDIYSRLWGVVSDTLFTVTYDKSTNSFSVSEQMTLGKNSYNNSGVRQWFPRSMVFDGEVLYVAFETQLCRYNTYDGTYEVLLSSNDINQIPNSYVLSEDGDLYYIVDGDLYMLNLNPTAEESAAAAQVNSLIAQLPEEVAAADSQLIHQTQEAYEALTSQEKALVTDSKKLEDAWIKLIIARIALLEESLSVSNMDQITELKADYDKVPMKRRSEVTNYADLAELNDTVLESHYAVNDQLYADLESAIEAASEDGKISLLQDAQEQDVLLTKGVTLDLKGFTLKAEILTADIAPDALGYVVDSSSGNEGLLKMTKDAVFRQDNEDMPLYDNASGGYRFFDYDLYLHETTESAGKGNQKFWFKFHFYTDDTCTELDQDAYDIVKAGKSGLEISADLTWKGKALSTVTFGYGKDTDAFCKAWANGITESRWLYLIVSGLANFELEGILTVEPIITANGVTVSSGKISYEKTSDLDFGFVDRT